MWVSKFGEFRRERAIFYHIIPPALGLEVTALEVLHALLPAVGMASYTSHWTTE